MYGRRGTAVRRDSLGSLMNYDGSGVAPRRAQSSHNTPRQDRKAETGTFDGSHTRGVVG